MRLIDADEFFQKFPELAIEPYINAPTTTPVLARQVNGTILLIPTRTFEDIKNGTISSIEIRGEEE